MIYKQNYYENMDILKASFLNAWEKVAKMEALLDKDLIKTVTAKNSLPNLKVKDKYLHNQNNPRMEALAFIDQFKNMDNHAEILFYGIGLGYQLKAFMERYPDKPFSVYEPVPEILYQFLVQADLREYPPHLLRNIYIEEPPDDPNLFCFNLVKKIRSSILIIDLPFYKEAFPEKRQAFFTQFENHLKERKMSLAANSNFEKRWTINSVKNLMTVINTPNIILQKKGFYKNKPALLVASGPSLEEEIENLREIRAAGSAYIFTVGTSINALVSRDIYPHAAFTYDPSIENLIVCKEILANGITSIPLIFGSTVGYETLEAYPGPQMHVIINQDTLAGFYLKPSNGEQLEYINDAASIAVVALQVLYKLGFNPIILAGQNLAYLNGRIYTPGSTFPSAEAITSDLKDAITVKDVFGNEVLSSSGYVNMRLQIENYLSSFQETKVINTTKNGAHIKGTEFRPMTDVMKDYLGKQVVQDDWADLTKYCYDPEHLLTQSKNMDTAREKISVLLERCKHDLYNIVKVAVGNDLLTIEQSYDQFNLSMENLRSNKFFATFITPMSRVELEFLLLVIPEISGERDPQKKAQMMEKEFGQYLKICEEDINTVLPLYQELNNLIRQYYQNHQLQKKAASIKLLLIEADGILTDGAVYYSASGDELKKFNYKDHEGILCLQELGIKTILFIPEGDQVLKNASEKFGVTDTACENGNKEKTIAGINKKYSLDNTEIAYVFHDLSKPELFKQVGLRFAVKNTDSDLRQKVDYILDVNGGDGVVLEIAKLIEGSIRPN